MLVLIIGLAVYFMQTRLEEKRLAGTRPIAEQPVQESTDAQAIQHDGFEIQPVARYEIRAKVLSTERYRSGREADLSPVDFALGWGPMSDHAVTKQLDISQGNRWYQYSWSDAPPIDPAVIVRTSANTHLVPADDPIKARLLKVRRGEIVRLQGYLVNIKRPDGWSWRSSLTREDSGAGSCELMWVESVSVD